MIDFIQSLKSQYIIRNNDLFEHYTLRVEPPILNVLPKVIFEDDKLLVISKPPYLSVHATGGFHFNSLVGLLKFEMNYNSELYVLHRIDKLTTGVLIMAKDRDITKKFHESDDIKKSYLARVHGNFSHDYLEYEKPIYCVSKKEGTYAVLDSTDEEEIKAKGAKLSKTIFKKIWYDPKSDSSLLECSPITGRTHQIRVHVSSLGFSIINDTQYGGKFLGNGFIMVKFPHLFTAQQSNLAQSAEQSKVVSDIVEKKVSPSPSKSQDIQEDSEVIQKKLKNNQSEAINTSEKVVEGQSQDKSNIGNEEGEEEKLDLVQNQNQLKEVDLDGSYKLSEEDGIYKLEGNFIQNHEWDYQKQPMEICLHSIKYTFQSYVFEDEKPYWADQNFNFNM